MAADGTELAIRRWDSADQKGVVVLLHGLISHAGWMDNIASRIQAAGFSVLCPDRRGSGQHTKTPGDISSTDDLLSDMDQILDHCEQIGAPLHLIGSCWGANYLIHYLARNRLRRFETLCLLAPGLFPRQEVIDAAAITGDSPEPTCTPPVPIEAFTSGSDFESYIVPDPYRLRLLSPRFNRVVGEISTFMGVKLAKVRGPILLILAEDDRVTDNPPTLRAFELLRGTKKCVYVPGEHGVQFDAPASVSNEIVEWITAQ